ncbi:MAG: 50S ribosomal protein L11 methyltransferase [Flavobacteriales bacterium]
MNYYELQLHLTDFSLWNDIMVAYLAELEFESFVEEAPILKAYIPENAFDGAALQALLGQVQQQGAPITAYDLALLPQQNWNATWESQFEPVYINEQLRIVAPFHDLPPFEGLEITILPKMSFGTGHHQTTHLICQNMLQMDFKDKIVLDMGSGTGVLAILAEKLGAKTIDAIEIEEWSAENILENVALNDSKRIKAIHGGAETIAATPFDIILANINKNVLLAQLPQYGAACAPNGLLLLSGFFVTDAPDLVAAAANEGFEWLRTDERENWAVVLLKKMA